VNVYKLKMDPDTSELINSDPPAYRPFTKNQNCSYILPSTPRSGGCPQRAQSRQEQEGMISVGLVFSELPGSIIAFSSAHSRLRFNYPTISRIPVIQRFVLFQSIIA